MKTAIEITAGEGEGIDRITADGVELLRYPVLWRGTHETTAQTLAEVMNSPTIIAWTRGATVVWSDRTALQRAWFYITAALRLRRRPGA